MARELRKVQLIERSLIKKYRKELWNPFIACVQRYRLVNEGDRIAVIIDGTPASMLTAKLLQQLQRISNTVFSLKMVSYTGMDAAACENSALLELPYITVTAEETPNDAALLSQLECNKLAYGTCRSEVVETVLAAMLYRGTVEAQLPKTVIANSDNGERILPLYCIDRDAVNAWVAYNGLFSVTSHGTGESAAVSALVSDLKKGNPDIERNVFQSLHAVCRDTLPGYLQGGVQHSFTERFEAMMTPDKK